MAREECRRAREVSPMNRAKRCGLARNAAVALGNIGTADDIPVLDTALWHDESLMREHAAYALARLGSATGSELEHHVETAMHADERGHLPDR